MSSRRRYSRVASGEGSGGSAWGVAIVAAVTAAVALTLALILGPVALTTATTARQRTASLIERTSVHQQQLVSLQSLLTANTGSAPNCTQTWTLFRGSNSTSEANCGPDQATAITGRGLNVTFHRISSGMAVITVPPMGCYGTGEEASRILARWPANWAFADTSSGVASGGLPGDIAVVHGAFYTEDAASGGQTNEYIVTTRTPSGGGIDGSAQQVQFYDIFEATPTAVADDWGPGHGAFGTSWADRANFRGFSMPFALADDQADPCDTPVTPYALSPLQSA